MDTEHRLVLLAPDGSALAHANLVRELIHFCVETNPDDPTDMGGWDEDTNGFNATVPAVPGGTSLAILAGEHVVWSRRAPSRPPMVDSVTCTIDAMSGSVTWTEDLEAHEYYQAYVDWSQGSLRGRLELSPSAKRVAHDEASRVSQRLKFDPFDVPQGELVLRVVVGDGFFLTASEAITVVAPRRPLRLEVSLVCVARDNGPNVRARAVARDWKFGTLHDEAYQWFVDGKKLFAGTTASFDSPAPGSETTLVVLWQGERLELRAPLDKYQTYQVSLVGAVKA